MEIEAREHNKLVRDGVPEWIEKNGGVAEVKIVKNDDVYLSLLLQKLVEEAVEVSKAVDKEHLIEELGDVESVVDAILWISGVTREELEAQKKKKDKEKGKFKKRIFLKRTKG